MVLGRRNNPEDQPEKVVFVARTPLGAALKLLFVGAALGSAGTFYLLQREATTSDPATASAPPEKAKQLLSRLAALATSFIALAQSTRQDVVPQWQEALETAKSTAAETEHDLQRDIEQAN